MWHHFECLQLLLLVNIECVWFLFLFIWSVIWNVKSLQIASVVIVEWKYSDGDGEMETEIKSFQRLWWCLYSVNSDFKWHFTFAFNVLEWRFWQSAEFGMILTFPDEDVGVCNGYEYHVLILYVGTFKRIFKFCWRKSLIWWMIGFVDNCSE